MEMDLVTSGVAEQDSVELDDYSNTEAINYEAERCGICMDIIIDRGVLDCCQHWFCFVCIDNWATITNLCPLCQNEFQLITCVPVYDTIGTSKVDEDSYFRDDDWSIEGKNNTLSFPSYYIDENAVICLDGDGCKIRNASATAEGDSNLDTSIACDSCDLWYHAFCVGFDPEGTSETESTWLCPRCIVDEVPPKPDGSLEQPSSNPSGLGNANRESLSEDTYSRKVSISVADSGETAIVVSMVGGNKLTEEPQESVMPTHEVDKDFKTQTFVLTSEESSHKLTTSSEEKSITQPILKARELELSLSCDASISFPSSCSVKREVLIGADTSMNEHGDFGGIKCYSGQVVNESHTSNPIMGLHLGLSVGTFLSVDEMNNNVTEEQINEGLKQHKPSEENSSGAEKSVEDADKDEPGAGGVKRKHSDCSDQIHVNANANVDDETKIETEDSSKKMKAEGRIQPILPSPKDEVIVSASDDSEDVPLVAAPSDDKSKCVSEQETAASDIMSIVKDTNRRPSKGHKCRYTDGKSSKELETVAGLRVKKIMKRAAEDKESSVVVQTLRKEIRDAVRNKSVKDYGENLFDPKLLAAFRAAVAGPKTESAKTLACLAVKAKKSMLQKGKVRENLTKKIYSHSNGRRKRAWDRDCEVEFWKHRCLQTSKPEKIQTLKSVLDLLRNDSEHTEIVQGSKRQATDPILSRLYLADTSVFPRKDDIKPLAALKTSGDLEASNKQPTLAEKRLKSSLDNSSSAETDKGQTKVVKKSNACTSLKDSSASSKVHLNKHADGSSLSSLGSSKSNTHKEAAFKSEDKKSDKRKWALQFLARKTGGGGEGVANGKQEDMAILKGNYPLLALLPIDMRPVLAPSRHNKIPMSVRQAQLFRLTEHLLRKANVPVIRRTAETELAVADAVNIEKEVADKSNSKPVYLNLCSREILHRSENKSSTGPEADSLSRKVTEMDSSLLSTNPSDTSEQSGNELSTDPTIQEALKNAGLLSDSPPNSPDQRMEVQPDEGGTSVNVREEGPEDIFEMDNVADLDIYGEFEYNLDDEDYIGVSATKVTKVQPEEGTSKLKLVFSTLHSERSSSTSDVERKENLGNAEVPSNSSSVLDEHTDVGLVNSAEGGTDNSLVPTEALFGKEGEEPSVAECEELYGPDKEPVIAKLPEGDFMKLYGLSDAETVDGRSMDCAPNQAIGNESCAEKSASIGHNSSAGESSSNRSEMNETTSQKGKKSNADSVKRPDNSIYKKVEAYIKEHIRPLCKSGVITAEQYRWAVAKATEKVMKYHCKAKNANFLIKEGEKVKKLAEQYVEAAKQKEKGDSP